MTPGGGGEAGIPLWRQIRGALAGDIASGRYAPGDRLPSEARLAARFGVNRHTLRRALADLAASGLIHVRRGTGATVTEQAMPYTLGSRTRFRENVARAGRVPGMRLLRLETLRADAAEAEALALAPGEAVHVMEAVGLADDQPVSLTRSVFPGARFPDLPLALRETGSVTAAFARIGLDDYVRAWTRLSAGLADATAAGHLRLPVGAPLLVSRAFNVDREGRPVELGRASFAGARVELLVEAPVQTDLSPSGHEDAGRP